MCLLCWEESCFQLSENCTLRMRKLRPAPYLPPTPSPGAGSLHTRPAHPGPAHPTPRNSSKNLSSSCGGREPGQPTAGTSKGIYKYSCRRKNRHFSSSSQPCLSPTPNLSWLDAYPVVAGPKPPTPGALPENRGGEQLVEPQFTPKELNFCPCLPCQVSEGHRWVCLWKVQMRF